MPPALDKTLEKDHRIHISSPVLTRDMDSSMDMNHELKLMDDNYSRFWLNLSSLSILDSCSINSSPELSEMPLQSLVHNSHKIELQPSLGSLLAGVSMDKSGADCPLLHKDSSLVRAAVEEQSRIISKDYENLTQTLSPLQYFQRESEPLYSARPNGIRTSNGHNALSSWHVASHSAMQQEVNSRTIRLASQHRVLATRTDRVKLRLHALLGENALKTFNKQLEGIKRKLSPMSTKQQTEPDSLSPADSKCASGSGVHKESNCLPDHFSRQKCLKFSGPAAQQGSGIFSSSLTDSSVDASSESVQVIRGVQRLVQCGRTVLHKAQQALDSDVTESSSDDELEEETKGKRPSSRCLGCEWRFQCERAKLASQWTWLKLRLSELDLQIQQVSQLHQHLLTNKGGVVLAQTQPLTDLQIQQTLLTETAGLTLTAGHTPELNSELDMEPSSPTRLLRNIERQSAQLSQIVNSLMAPLSDPLSHCPVEKGDSRCWRGSRKRPFNSRITDVLLHTSSTCSGERDQKKRRVCRRGQFPSQAEVTRVCARTRPLLSYHKPRLFIMDQSPVTEQGADTSAYRCLSSVSGALMNVCSDPDTSNSTNYTINGMLKPNKSSPSHCVHTAFFKEDWLHRSRSISPSPRFTSTFNCTHKLQASQMPIKATSTQQTPIRSCRRTAKRRRKRRADADMCVSQFVPSAEDSTEDRRTRHYSNIHPRKTQFPLRRRNGESVYNINNIVIPMSLAASTTVEKLQYKDIPTPSWKVVELFPIVEKEVEKHINKLESLSDEVFVQRHQSYERREKLYWSPWEKGKRCAQRTRSSSSTDVFSDYEPTSWTCRTPTDAPPDNREPEPPWERRVFPLPKTDEETLTCDEDTLKSENEPRSENEDTESSLTESSRNSVSSVCYAYTPPSAGHTQSNTRRATPMPTPTDISPVQYRKSGLRSTK